MKKRQELTITVVTSGDSEPADVVRTVLEGVEGVTVEEVDGSGVEEVPEVNKKRLVALAVWVAGEDAKRRLGLPNEWDQRTYFARNSADVGTAVVGCGTACCVAGKVALEDGGLPMFSRWGDQASMVRFPNGDEETAESYARLALGLSEDQASELFAGNNDLDSVLRIIGKLTGSAAAQASSPSW